MDAAAWGNGVCAGDSDGDGRLDLYVTNFGPNFLFRNRGDGTFTDVAVAAGVQAGGWSTGCAFFDGNGDGRPRPVRRALRDRRPGTTSSGRNAP